MKVQFKQSIQYNKAVQAIYFSFKRIFFLFFQITPLKFVADINFRTPIRDFFFHPKKLYLFSKIKPYTASLYHHMNTAYTLAERVKKENISGSFVECGGSQDGVAAVMALVDPNRKTWYLHFHEDLPQLKFAPAHVVEGLHLPRTNNIILTGKADELLSRSKKEIGSVAILRLNNGLYELTLFALEILFDSVVNGGFVVINDYGNNLSRKDAIRRFFHSRGREISSRLIDGETVFKKFTEAPL